MSKEDFLRELEEALAGDVPEAVIRDNIRYYGSYLTQEMAQGRSVEEVVGEIGEPFLIAKTIIEHSEAAGETVSDDGYGEYQDMYGSSRGTGFYGSEEKRYESRQRNPFQGIHYIDLNKWYWKLLGFLLLFVIVTTVFRVTGAIFALLIRFAGPLMMIFLVYWIIKNFRR